MQRITDSNTTPVVEQNGVHPSKSAHQMFRGSQTVAQLWLLEKGVWEQRSQQSTRTSSMTIDLTKD